MWFLSLIVRMLYPLHHRGNQEIARTHFIMAPMWRVFYVWVNAIYLQHRSSKAMWMLMYAQWASIINNILNCIWDVYCSVVIFVLSWSAWFPILFKPKLIDNFGTIWSDLNFYIWAIGWTDFGYLHMRHALYLLSSEYQYNTSPIAKYNCKPKLALFTKLHQNHWG